MNLEELREKINSIDEQMVKLFIERMQAAAKIAGNKAEHKLPILDQKRESEVLNRVIELAGDDFAMYTRMLYATLFDLSRSYQASLMENETDLAREIEKNVAKMKMEFPKKAVVACQGVEGSYAQQAGNKIFPLANMMFFKSFESVFNAVEMGMCQYGILPIENSSAGSVSEVYDLMVKHKFYIVKSVKLHVNHSLLSKEKIDISQVKEIVSHEQALNQCSEFLKKHDGVKITVFENTATAAKYVAEIDRTDIAAISSPECARLYGLHVIDGDIQNNQNNYTRFICIAKDMEIYAGADKISLMLSVSHRPGALHDMIGKVSSHGLNLSKLESRPIPGKDFEFRFYFDIDASVYSKEVINLLNDMSISAEQLAFLGCYAEA